MTIDVEDYFHVSAFASALDRANWPAFESRVERNTHRLLDLFDELPPGTTELVVHPGFADDTLRAIDPYTIERERELQALTSDAVRQRLQRGDFRLVPMGEVSAGSCSR